MLFEDVSNCNRDKAFMSIIITIIPSWAIVTTLIIFVLLTFHRNLRSTKVYDDCTKSNAQYVYYLDLRTGETSPTYTRRKTTLTIDMYDDNQVTLARIFIPGHVIFGRKDAPILPIDDEKFSELRVTRFWLYRATKLKKVSTIRLSHNCPELDARIMVYGVELRTDEPDRFKMFFPVMSYISVYGPTGKPNACFDTEPAGYISAIGGHVSDMTYLDEHLTLVDITILINLSAAIIFFLTGEGIVTKRDSSEVEIIGHVYNGCIAGFISYITTIVLGLTMRFVIRQNYALRLGQGGWSVVFYLSSLAILSGATTLWIITGLSTYKHLCPDQHLLWVLAVFIGVAVAIALALLTFTVHTFIQYLNPSLTEQYVVPEEMVPDSHSRTRHQMHFRHNLNPISSKAYALPTQQAGLWHQQASPNTTGHLHLPGYLHGTAYGSPLPMQNYKTQEGAPRYGQQQQRPVQADSTTYQQQVAPDTTVHGSKSVKKIGSSESTGSTYYQQLIKTKGGVKSISQYGELLKQKKPNKHNK